MNQQKVDTPSGNPPASLPQSMPQTAGQAVTAAFLILYFAIQPLIVHYGYFDITEAKQACFLLLSCAYVLCMTCVTVVDSVGRRQSSRLPHSRNMRACDWLMLGFAGCFCISAILSPFPLEMLFAQPNRYQGVLTIVLYAMLWFGLSRNGMVSSAPEIALIIAFCGATLLTLLQAFGLDPFGLRAPLAVADRLRYVSTLGNINFYSSYVSVILPFILIQWSFAAGWRRWLYGTAIVLCAGGTLFTGSESFVLAFVVCLLVPPVFLFGKPRAMKRLCLGLFTLLGAMEGVFLLSRLLPIQALPVSFSLRLMLSPAMWCGLMALCCAGWLLARRAAHKNTIRLRKRYLFILALLLICAGIFLLLANTVFSGYSFGSADRFLKLNGAWGTDRGRIWRFCMEEFQGFDLTHQLFGGGPGCLSALDAGRNVFADASIDSAHNEFLHYLLTIGWVGLAGYLGLLICVCIPAIRICLKEQVDPLAPALLICVLCYLAQSVVNIAQPFSTPYLFIFLGLLRGQLPHGKASIPVDWERTAAGQP